MNTPHAQTRILDELRARLEEVGCYLLQIGFNRHPDEDIGEIMVDFVVPGGNNARVVRHFTKIELESVIYNPVISIADKIMQDVTDRFAMRSSTIEETA
jgi:hypothetical protein